MFNVTSYFTGPIFDETLSAMGPMVDVVQSDGYNEVQVDHGFELTQRYYKDQTTPRRADEEE